MPSRPAAQVAANPDRNLTDLRPQPKRDRRAEADRHRLQRTPLHRRIVGLCRRAGIEPEVWQVESLAATLVANHEEPTDAELMRALMRAPWAPKPGLRHWRVGEGGGWAVRSDA